MKKYNAHYMLLILAAGLIILGACGSGSIIDLSDTGSNEYRGLDDARLNLIEDGALIMYCTGKGKADESCQKFNTIISSSEEESSSSAGEEYSSSEGEVSSSSEKELSSSSSSISITIYDIPEFDCLWVPSSVAPGGNVQVEIKFKSSNQAANQAAEVDCVTKAWLGVAVPNITGLPSGGYDTSYFEKNKNYVVSGSVLGTAVQWPSSGEFKTYLYTGMINPDNPPRIVRSTVSCVNPSAGKTPDSRTQECEPLFVGSITCNMTAKTGTVGMPISPAPTASCNGTLIAAESLEWTPANFIPTTDGALTVSVKASGGSCKGMTADCESITVSPPTLTCDMTATEGTIGVPISAPTVKCNGTAVTTGLAWTPANLTPTEAGSFGVSVTIGSGICQGMTKSCGSVTVPELPSSSSVAPSSSSVLPSSSSSATLTCTNLATTGTVGVSIQRPTVSCNGGSAITNNLTWTPNTLSSSGATLTPTVAGNNIAVSVTVGGTGACSGMTRSCGSITVSAAPSSSSSSSATLTCGTIASTGKVGVAVARPTVTCGTATVTTGLNWTPTSLTTTGSGNNLTLTPTATGNNIAVSVSASSGTCNGQSATCGSITVAAADLTCNMTATTGTVGTAITPAPTVSCNGTNVANNNLTWTPANYIPTATGSVQVSATVGTNGYCAGRTISCGNVTVSPAGGGGTSCIGETNIETYCPGVTWANVKYDSDKGNECIFVTDISKWHDGNSYTDPALGMVNGNNFITMCGQTWGGDANKPCTEVLSGQGINPIDGGYYIYKFHGYNTNSAVTIGTAPNCNN